MQARLIPVDRIPVNFPGAEIKYDLVEIDSFSYTIMLYLLYIGLI